MDLEYISLSKFHYNNIKKPSLPLGREGFFVLFNR